MQDEKIINRIQALMDKANSTDSIEESNTFMAKAMELLAKHNIESFRLKRSDASSKIIQEKIKLDEYYERSLLRILCENNLCEYINLNWKDCICVGKEQNVNVVMYLFSWYRNMVIIMGVKSFNSAIKKEILHVFNQNDELEREEIIAMAEKISPINKVNYIDSYRSGCVYGVQCAFRDMGSKMYGVEDYGLMVTGNKDEIIEYIRAYIDSSFGMPVPACVPSPEPEPMFKSKRQPKPKPIGKRELKKMEEKNRIYSAAWSAGMEDGKKLRQNANQVKGSEKVKIG